MTCKTYIDTAHSDAKVEVPSETKNTQVDIAVKTCKRGCSQDTLRGVLSEIKIMSFLGKHPKVVSLLGAYTNDLSQGNHF